MAGECSTVTLPPPRQALSREGNGLQDASQDHLSGFSTPSAALQNHLRSLESLLARPFANLAPCAALPGKHRPALYDGQRSAPHSTNPGASPRGRVTSAPQ